MDYLQSILLGVLQGIAEFLPISSSGHLAVFQSAMGLEAVPVAYDVLLHLATLLVVLFYFRKLIGRLFVVLFRFLARKSKVEDTEDLYMILAVLLSTAVTFSGYLVLKLWLGETMDSLKENKVLVFSLFLFTGIFLIVQSFFHPEKKGKITPWQAVGVGLGQILGLFPGISRSGATISASTLVGIDRKRAGELSFLISIPAIVGAVVFDFKDAIASFSGESLISLPVLFVGMLAAFIAGMIVFPLLLKMLQKEKLWLFSFYLIPLGIVGIIYNVIN